MTDDFVRLFTRHERRIFSYILTLVADYTAADDVFQQTSLVLWQKFDEFQPGTNFGAWACRVAHYKVLNYRKQQRNLKIRFSSEFIETIAATKTKYDKDFEDRRDALYHCLRKLPERDVELLKQRYSGKMTSRRLAENLGRPVNTVYKSLARIRRTLLGCVRRTLSSEETA